MVTWQKPVPGLSDATFRRFILKIRGALQVRGEVDVLITSNARMRALNRQFRGKDKPTDVLSFPSAEDAALLKRNGVSAGDVAISAEIAARNARLLGHSAANEVKILALHGILHLAGYDHDSDGGEMARKEARLRRDLRLPGNLIERAQASRSAPASRRRPASGEQKRRRVA
jgi:probable rRNA maturation factor